MTSPPQQAGPRQPPVGAQPPNLAALPPNWPSSGLQRLTNSSPVRASARRSAMVAYLYPANSQVGYSPCLPYSRESIARWWCSSPRRASAAKAIRRARLRSFAEALRLSAAKQDLPIQDLPMEPNLVARPARVFRVRRRDTSSGVWWRDRCGNTNARPEASAPSVRQGNRRPRALCFALLL